MRHLLPFLALAMIVSSSSPAAARATLATGTAPEIPWLRLLLSFLFCIGVAVAAILLLRRYQQRTGAGVASRFLSAQGLRADTKISILEARRVSPSGQLCLVEFDERQLLLAVTDSNITILAEKQADEEPGESGSNS